MSTQMQATPNVVGEVTGHFQKMFEFFNEELGAKLTTPVFTLIPNQGRQSYYGWYYHAGWKTDDGVVREVNITADQLQRPIEDLCETTLHEMAHLANAAEGIEDCSKTQYHNQKFRKRAEAFGLVVSKGASKGWCYTKLGEKGTEIVEKYKRSLGNTNPFAVHRVAIKKPMKESDKMTIMVDKEIGQAARVKFENAKAFRAYIEKCLQAVGGTVVKDEV